MGRIDAWDMMSPLEFVTIFCLEGIAAWDELSLYGPNEYSKLWLQVKVELFTVNVVYTI